MNHKKPRLKLAPESIRVLTQPDLDAVAGAAKKNSEGGPEQPSCAMCTLTVDPPMCIDPPK